MMNKFFIAPFMFLLSALLTPAYAASIDFTVLTSAVNFDSVIAALMTIGAAGVTLYLAWGGIRKVWSTLRSV